MCVTTSPAHLSNTILYAGHALREGKLVAVLAYQNRASSVGPNAMILPFPAAAPMGPENIVDTRVGGHFLTSMDEQARHRSKSVTNYRSIGASAASKEVQIFDSGSYTVVLASKPSLIPGALKLVPENKRAHVSYQLLAAYSKLYPDHQVAVCCWEGDLKAEPLLWWYEPKDKRLFLPTLDAHDGGAPRPGEVHLDHTLMWRKNGGEFKVGFDHSIPEMIRDLLPTHVDAMRLESTPYVNGDFWVDEDGNLTHQVLRA